MAGAVSLGELDLSGLDLVGLDLDELAELADSTRRDSIAEAEGGGGSVRASPPISPPDAFRSAASQRRKRLALRARREYCESLTSDEGSGGIRSWTASSQSSMTSRSSWTSSRSNGSNASSNKSRSRGRSGKALIALGLGAAEVLAISANKKMYQSQRGAALEDPAATAPTAPKAAGRGALASQTYAQAAAAEKPSPAVAATYERLTEAELDRMREDIPGLSRLASVHLQYLLAQYSLSHRHLMKRHARRFEYEFRTRKMGGSRRVRRTGTREPILLGQFVSKHVFLPKTRFLQKNGSLLFLKMFNLFVEKKWDAIAKLRKDGFVNVRESMSATSDPWLYGRFVEQIIEDPAEKTKSSTKARRPRGTGRRSRSRRRLPHESAGLKSKRSIRSDQANKASESSFVEEGKVSDLPSHIEAWVDEDGVKVWRDKNTGRTLNSTAIRNPLSDPYTSWSKVIDAGGRTLYVREDTGEAVVAQDMDTDKVMGDHPKVSERKTRSTKPRKSVSGRAMKRISKWMFKRVGGRAQPAGKGAHLDAECGGNQSNDEVVVHVL